MRVRAARAGAVAGLLAVVLAGTPLGGAAGATTPPWEPDEATIGACSPATAHCDLRLYDAAGRELTSGSIHDAPFAAYAQADQPDGRSGDLKAELYIATPVKGQASGDWGNENVSPSRSYPVAGAPAPLNNAGARGSGLPMADLGTSAGNETLATYIADYPNRDASTSDGYGGMYQLRLFTLGAGGESVNYWSADIHVSGDRWTLVYPPAGPPPPNPGATGSPASGTSPSPGVGASPGAGGATPSAHPGVTTSAGTTATVVGPAGATPSPGATVTVKKGTSKGPILVVVVGLICLAAIGVGIVLWRRRHS